MQFGVCGDLKMAAAAAEVGMDFCEAGVGGLLKPRESEEAFSTVLAQVREAPLPIPVVNCFIPGDLKITGPDVDAAALRDYVAVACERARRAGVECIVFGSGGARRIPDGFDIVAAHGQLVDFGSMVARIACDCGVTIVVEPLNRAECNVLTSVGECAALVREVSHPGLRLLVDGYHLLKDNDSCADIVANGDLLVHVHIATVPNRQAPGAEPCEDLTRFFVALVNAGYDGRISVEGRLGDPADTLPPALALMKQLEARARTRS